ncbi:hypothetical protein K461DRAFT_97949 [Myriangium duriaei CBS 260.36]|uniref:Uncharacterized protein n=1 Tax=Myriangium duriaei CBS 260.36 TaxID=1168546 RepID=A0A9P4J7F1_9PEZI|nr:hypothetical protein K461DRAFT_97949 [Myriangium duriaei CBS 260.36]
MPFALHNRLSDPSTALCCSTSLRSFQPCIAFSSSRPPQYLLAMISFSSLLQATSFPRPTELRRIREVLYQNRGIGTLRHDASLRF